LTEAIFITVYTKDNLQISNQQEILGGSKILKESPRIKNRKYIVRI
jgi:hypothetical protein